MIEWFLIFAFSLTPLLGIAAVFNHEWNKYRGNVSLRRKQREFNAAVFAAVLVASIIFAWLVLNLNA